jgi:hypothetical protein
MMDLMRNGMHGQMGSNDAVPADSFQGGLADLESALMGQQEEYKIDELQQPKQQEMNPQMMMLLQAMMGGMM